MARKKPAPVAPVEPSAPAACDYPTMLYRDGDQQVIAHSAADAATLEADGWAHEPHDTLVVEDHSVARTRT